MVSFDTLDNKALSFHPDIRLTAIRLMSTAHTRLTTSGIDRSHWHSPGSSPCCPAAIGSRFVRMNSTDKQLGMISILMKIHQVAGY